MRPGGTMPKISRILIILCAAVSLVVVNAPRASALYISELLASNDTGLVDEDGDFSDWLEIYNETASSVDVGGYYLTDDEDALTKWQLPSVSIAPDGYLLVWASDKDRSNPAAPLHTNFKLSAGGEYLALVAPDGTTIVHEYAPAFPEQVADRSYGLASDLVTERCFVNPTPGAASLIWVRVNETFSSSSSLVLRSCVASMISIFSRTA